MELSLSIGETQKEYKLCMGSFSSSTEDEKRIRENDQKTREYSSTDSFIPPHFSPLHIHYSRLSFPCLHQNPNLILIREAGNGYSSRVGRKVRDEADEEGATGSSSSPNTTISSLRGMYDDDDKSKRNNYVFKRHNSGSDEEEENGMAGRKKLRLTKDQSAFLEDSFKQHNTLNPKQKIGLAKQLSLRPRQVEVWFQNRRARTKLKQTEVDCEYLKRCCETLREEKRKLQKELLELRTLKSAASNMQLPATTLTICPSCQRVASPPTNPIPILHAFLQDQPS